MRSPLSSAVGVVGSLLIDGGCSAVRNDIEGVSRQGMKLPLRITLVLVVS